MPSSISTSLQFRHATEADIPALIDLVTSAYRGDSSRNGWTTEADLLGGQRIDATMLRTDLTQPDSIVVIAEDCGRMVACAHVCAERLPDGTKTGHFGMFSVDPTIQRGGIGKSVLAEAERVTRETLGCDCIRMHVIDCREELIAFYQRRGYTRTGIKMPFPYGDPRYGLPTRDDLQFELLEKRLESAP